MGTSDTSYFQVTILQTGDGTRTSRQDCSVAFAVKISRDRATEEEEEEEEKEEEGNEMRGREKVMSGDLREEVVVKEIREKLEVEWSRRKRKSLRSGVWLSVWQFCRMLRYKYLHYLLM